MPEEVRGGREVKDGQDHRRDDDRNRVVPEPDQEVAGLDKATGCEEGCQDAPIGDEQSDDEPEREGQVPGGHELRVNIDCGPRGKQA